MTKSGDVCKDLVGRLRPDERARLSVGDVDVSHDRCLQLARAAMDAAPDLLLGQHREPPLDQVDPRRTRRGEVYVVAGMTHQPTVNERGLVRPVIVEDDVNVEGAACSWRTGPTPQ
jgi:hypothetical protein